MQHLEVSCAVRRFFKSLGFKGLIHRTWSRSEQQSLLVFNAMHLIITTVMFASHGTPLRTGVLRYSVCLKKMRVPLDH